MKLQFRDLSLPHSKVLHEAEIAPGVPVPVEGDVVRVGFSHYRVDCREFRYGPEASATLTVFLAVEPDR